MSSSILLVTGEGVVISGFADDREFHRPTTREIRSRARTLCTGWMGNRCHLDTFGRRRYCCNGKKRQLQTSVECLDTPSTSYAHMQGH